MRLHLDSRWTERICGLPERGMGYHVLDVLLRNSQRVRNVLVFNAQEMEWPPHQRRIQAEDIVDITKSGR